VRQRDWKGKDSKDDIYLVVAIMSSLGVTSMVATSVYSYLWPWIRTEKAVAMAVKNTKMRFFLVGLASRYPLWVTGARPIKK
jgi:hypothetical protein